MKKYMPCLFVLTLTTAFFFGGKFMLKAFKEERAQRKKDKLTTEFRAKPPEKPEEVFIGKKEDMEVTFNAKNWTLPYTESLSIGGKDKSVIINYLTGRVSWKGYTPDEASRAFWDHVVLIYPDIKTAIIEEYKKEQQQIENEQAKSASNVSILEIK